MVYYYCQLRERTPQKATEKKLKKGLDKMRNLWYNKYVIKRETIS